MLRITPLNTSFAGIKFEYTGECMEKINNFLKPDYSAVYSKDRCLDAVAECIIEHCGPNYTPGLHLALEGDIIAKADKKVFVLSRRNFPNYRIVEEESCFDLVPPPDKM